MPPSTAQGLIGSSPINRPKGATVTAADNGFVISLDHTADYKQTFKVAKDTSEVADIISAYFATK